MYRWFAQLALLGVLLTTPLVYALSLQEAKEWGLVGETAEGYLGAVGEPSSDVRELIRDINAKRRAKYQAIAIRTGAELEAVEALAGKKAIEKTSPGQYVRVRGKWQKK